MLKTCTTTIKNMKKKGISYGTYGKNIAGIVRYMSFSLFLKISEYFQSFSKQWCSKKHAKVNGTTKREIIKA